MRIHPLHGPLALLGAAVDLASTPRPPTWSRRQALAAHMLRRVLRAFVDAPPELQRTYMAYPIPALAGDIREKAVTLGGRPALRWTPHGADETACLLHFHGGGYVIGAPIESRAYVTRLARKLGIPAVSVDYRLAPEHPWPAAVDDGVAAVNELATQVDPSRIVVTGDSAGGGLTLGAVIRLRDEGGPRVAGAMLGSPSCDFSMPGASIEGHARWDYLTREMAERWHGLYHSDPTAPAVSPRYADLSNLPPLRFVAGGLEIFHDDILATAEAAREAGTDVEVYVGEEGVHCFYANKLLPGPADAVDRMVDLVRGLL